MAEEKSEARSFDALARARVGREVTLRDDQTDFPSFLDAVKTARRRGARFRLIDTGKMNVSELEWLAESGADIYTSDEARPRKIELELLAKACSKGKAIAAYFHHGALGAEKEEGPGRTAFLAEIGRAGIDLHLSNRERRRHIEDLTEAAHACRSAGALFVFYHHGRPQAGLELLARGGGWVHLLDRDIESGEDGLFLADLARQACLSGAGVAVHIERGIDLDLARGLHGAGAHLLFKTPPSDYRSAFRTLERQTRKRTMPFRASYLYTTLLP